MPGRAPFKDRRFDLVAVVAFIVFFVAMLEGVVVVAVPAALIVSAIVLFAPRRSRRHRQ